MIIYFKTILAIITIFLPQILKKIIYRRLFKYQISSSSKIGFSYINVKMLILCSDSYIGHMNIIKNLSLLHLDDKSIIGNLNWITGFPQDSKSIHFSHQTDRNPSLYIGKHSSVTNRHLIDCTNTVTFGSFSTLGGFRSQILSHSIDFEQCRQSSSPVYISDYCFIGSGSILLPGCKIPNYSIVGAGSVITKDLKHEYTLYCGSPAKPVKQLDIYKYKYFTRKNGFVI
jgi:acetyltransferase-like isoleucine patch superfamily enzyme